jgi:hypothetical protein
VPTNRIPIKRRLAEHLAARQINSIGETEWNELRSLLAPVSDSYLRDLLRATGIAFEQPWSGVEQHTLADLERSLLGMLGVYEAAAQAGDRDKARYARRQVIAAKERAKFLAATARLSEDKRTLKLEMAQWMLVWLENPAVFPVWVEARKRAMAGEASSPERQ